MSDLFYFTRKNISHTLFFFVNGTLLENIFITCRIYYIRLKNIYKCTGYFGKKIWHYICGEEDDTDV